MVADAHHCDSAVSGPVCFLDEFCRRTVYLHAVLMLGQSNDLGRAKKMATPKRRCHD